jgi:hypothetical protein
VRQRGDAWLVQFLFRSVQISSLSDSRATAMLAS